MKRDIQINESQILELNQLMKLNNNYQENDLIQFEDKIQKWVLQNQQEDQIQKKNQELLLQAHDKISNFIHFYSKSFKNYKAQNEQRIQQKINSSINTKVRACAIQEFVEKFQVQFGQFDSSNFNDDVTDFIIFE
ncbi:Hypothetical_protein [Hexamita inflata]|uniref:Hypothetical_protein n=1 Tax=Hexamita inflata TaxID=28002 RepID=A0AA86Q6U1_9EUKA|nr:Hypothetical protein HINF_LOCUS38033 [Hexamita inflata]